MIWLERRVVALIQGRLGPNRVGFQGILQPVADAFKLFFKEDIIQRQADRFLFNISPVLVMFSSLLAFCFIPLGEPFRIGTYTLTLWIAESPVGLLLVLGLSSIGVFGVIFGGWASNSKYPLMGALRSVIQILSYEIPIGLTVLTVVFFSPVHGPRRDRQPPAGRRASGTASCCPVSFVVFWISGIAETNRAPFDLPEAESELVAGYHTEYSGDEVRLLLHRRVRPHGPRLVARRHPVLRRLAAALPERHGPRLPPRRSRASSGTSSRSCSSSISMSGSGRRFPATASTRYQARLEVAHPAVPGQFPRRRPGEVSPMSKARRVPQDLLPGRHPAGPGRHPPHYFSRKVTIQYPEEGQGRRRPVQGHAPPLPRRARASRSASPARPASGSARRTASTSRASATGGAQDHAAGEVRLEARPLQLLRPLRRGLPDRRHPLLREFRMTGARQGPAPLPSRRHVPRRARTSRTTSAEGASDHDHPRRLHLLRRPGRRLGRPRRHPEERHAQRPLPGLHRPGHRPASSSALQAEYLGAIQILVYGGGIVVLYIFVIIIVNLKEIVPERRKLFPKLFIIAVPVAPRWPRSLIVLFKEFHAAAAAGAERGSSFKAVGRDALLDRISSPSSSPRSCSWPSSSGPSSSPERSSSMIPINAVFGLGLLIFFIGLVRGPLPQEPGHHADVPRASAQRGQHHLGRAWAITSSSPRGSIFALFVIIMAVSEAAVGFALVLSYFRQKKTYDTDELNELKG